MKTKLKTLRIPEDVIADVERLAAQQNRSFSNMVIHLLKTHQDLQECIKLSGIHTYKPGKKNLLPFQQPIISSKDGKRYS